MDNHFNTPAEVIDLSIKACENKTRLPLGKMIPLGIMAGAFIAFGGATSSTAAHAVENVGVARALAGCIFPVGLMLIVFLGGELFTGNCLITAFVSVGTKEQQSPHDSSAQTYHTLLPCQLYIHLQQDT